MKSSEDDDSRAKRQRITPTPATTVHDLLSADLWCDIADFLPKTSRALLAVALTAPPASFRESGWKGQPNTLSKAIISSVKDGLYTGGQMPFETLLDELCEEALGEIGAAGPRRKLRPYGCDFRTLLQSQLEEYYNYQGFNSKQIASCAKKVPLKSLSNEQIKELNDQTTWHVLDFVDIPVSLASRLTDDDIGAILVCIDAEKKLERLTLTHCFNVVGTGLAPLRSSLFLEELDLRLHRRFETPMSESNEELVPSREIKLSEGAVCDIVGSIRCYLGGSQFKRLYYPYEWYDVCNIFNDCCELAHNSEDQLMRNRTMMKFLKKQDAAVWNKHTCCVYFGYDSKDDYCSSIYDDDDTDVVDHCISCEEVTFAVCSHCDELLCVECASASECRDCDTIYCIPCQENGFDVTVCNETVDNNVVQHLYCPECRISHCKNGSIDCNHCKALAFDMLSKKLDSQQEELDRSISMFTSKDSLITLRIKGLNGEETLATIERSTDMGKLLEAYESKTKSNVRFYHLSLGPDLILATRSLAGKTPESLGLHDMAEIRVVSSIYD